MTKAVITHHELPGLFEMYPNSDMVVAAHQLVYEYVYKEALVVKISNALSNNIKLTHKQALKLIKEDAEMYTTWLYNNNFDEIVMLTSGLKECGTGCGMCDDCIAIEQESELFLELFMQVMVVMEYDASTHEILLTRPGAKVMMIDPFTTMVKG